MVEEWAQKAIDIDSNYRSALEILGKYASKMTPPRTMTPPRATFNYRKKEEWDPNAMDVDAMSVTTYVTLSSQCKFSRIEWSLSSLGGALQRGTLDGLLST